MRTPQSTSTATQMSGNGWTLFVDGAEADEAMRAKQKELDRLAEIGVYETVDIFVALGKERDTTRWELDRRKGGIRLIGNRSPCSNMTDRQRLT